MCHGFFAVILLCTAFFYVDGATESGIHFKEHGNFQSYSKILAIRQDGATHGYYLSDLNVTWNTADETCKQSGLKLLTVKSEEKYYEVQELFRNSDRLGVEHWLNLVESRGWRWNDGEAANFTNFDAPWVPARRATEGNYWTTYSYDEGAQVLPFVCEDDGPSSELGFKLRKPKNEQLRAENAPRYTIDDYLKVSGTRDDGSEFAYYLSYYQTTYIGVPIHCGNIGMKALMIKSKEKQFEVSTVFDSVPERWFRWIGLENEWVWADNEEAMEFSMVRGGYFFDAIPALIYPDYTWSIYNGSPERNLQMHYVCEPMTQ